MDALPWPAYACAAAILYPDGADTAGLSKASQSNGTRGKPFFDAGKLSLQFWIIWYAKLILDHDWLL